MRLLLDILLTALGMMEGANKAPTFSTQDCKGNDDVAMLHSVVAYERSELSGCEGNIHTLTTKPYTLRLQPQHFQIIGQNSVHALSHEWLFRLKRFAIREDILDLPPNSE